MRLRTLHRTLTTFSLLLASVQPSQALHAQALEARIGRFYDSTGWTAYRLGAGRSLGGVFRVQVHADYLRQVTGAGSVAGLGADLTAFRTGADGPYLLAGLSGGLGSENSDDYTDLWGSWSVGAGYDLFPVSFMSIGAEGRWRQLSLGSSGGIELAIGAAVHLTRSSTGPGGTRPEGPPAVPLHQTGTAIELLPDPGAERTTPPQALNDAIVATAAEAMGRPYTYGGTGTDGGGFDCSGLIQYAYGKHGIALPRRSLDQAREGRKIDRRLKQLAPADILTFSNGGGRVSHVGLYIGEGRFIHSATRGVQVSQLSPEDPYGRWWYKRWVGVRRVVR